MKGRRNVHAFVMAGGNGSRLHPLTLRQCKPALPFGANYRVVDFVLGNLWNSGVPHVDLLVQYQPQTLADHVQRTWASVAGAAEPFVTVAPPPQPPYRGTADAVFRNLLRLPPRTEHVAVFGADHVYRMDVGQMIDFHAAHDADVTVATLPVPLAQAPAFGIVEVDAGQRVLAFHEKPRAPQPMPGRPGEALASMGNYVFSAAVLQRELERAGAAGETDFGQHVLPRLLKSRRVLAYDFHRQRAPGLAAHEDPVYWRDVGTIPAYFEAQLDTLGTTPRFALANRHWPFLPEAAGGAAAMVFDSETSCARFGPGALVDRAAVHLSIVGRGVQVRRHARLERSIVLDGAVVGAHAELRNTIVDEDNVIPPGERIGHDLARDRQRFHVTEDGIVVVPRGFFAAQQPTPPATVSLAH
jgi:glucose-1-phosphate adenylyltransferase